MKSFFVVVLMAVVIYAVIQRDEIARRFSHATEKVAEKNRSLRPENNMPMVANRLSIDSGVAPEVAVAQVKANLETARRFRLRGQVVERLPYGDLMIRGYVLEAGAGPSGPEERFALFGHPQTGTLAVNDPVECTVWRVGGFVFARKDGTNVSLEELIFTPLGPDAAPRAPRTPTLLEQKAKTTRGG